MIRYTLTGWRDAVKDPPTGIVMTDVGAGEHPGGQHWYYAGTSDIMDPQPRVWCDPVPPGEDGLTAAHVSVVLELAAAELNRRAELDASVSVGAANTAWVRLRAALPAE